LIESVSPAPILAAFLVGAG